MKKYGDYFIKDGKFIGKFEEMYQSFEDPWNQTKSYDDLSRQMVAHHINKNKIKSSVEFGCGLGKTMNFLYSKTGINMLGIDISETCIKKAKEAFPNLSFKVDNVENILEYANYECYFFSEITWCLLENKLIDRIFKLMQEYLNGKYFIHNLVFYKGQQQYGNNYFTNLNEFIDFCPFNLITKVEIDNVEDDCIYTSSIFKI